MLGKKKKNPQTDDHYPNFTPIFVCFSQKSLLKNLYNCVYTNTFAIIVYSKHCNFIAKDLDPQHCMGGSRKLDRILDEHIPVASLKFKTIGALLLFNSL
jgi:hypothetical protein